MNERRIATANEMFDLLSRMNAGKFVTICYVNAVPLLKTKRAVDMNKFGADLDANQPGEDEDATVYNQLRQYQSDESMKKLPITGIVSVTRYNLQWSSEDSFWKNRAKYAQQKDEIDKRYGIYKDPSERRAGGFADTNTFGISVGNTDNTRNTAYIHQNTAKSRTSSQLYVVDNDGNIVSTVKNSLISALRSVKSDSNVNALRKLEKSEEEIAQYQKEVAALNFRERKFIVDKILYIVATIDKEKFVFINDRLAEMVDKGLKINNKQFIDIANQMYRQDDTMTESMCRRYHEIKEALAAKFGGQLNESNMRYLSENVASQLIREFAEGEDDYGDWEDEEADTEPDYFKEYEEDYPDTDFNPGEMGQYELAKWCQTAGDFLYIYDSYFGGMKARAANSGELASEVANDVYHCGYIEPTHEADAYLNPRQVDFENNYIAVYKLHDVPGEDKKDYYVVYEKPKY